MEYKTKYNKGDYLYTYLADNSLTNMKYGKVVGITVKDDGELTVIFYHIHDEKTQQRATNAEQFMAETEEDALYKWRNSGEIYRKARQNGI